MIVDIKKLKRQIAWTATAGIILLVMLFVPAMLYVPTITPLTLWQSVNLFGFAIGLSPVIIMCICMGMWYNGRQGRSWWQDHADQKRFFEWKPEWRDAIKAEQESWKSR